MKKLFANPRFLLTLQIILVVGLIVTVRFISHPAGNDQYGYDYGFYAYTVQHTPLDSPAYFIGQVNDYGNHLFMILNWLRLPQLESLNILFIVFTALAGVLMFLYLRKYSLLAGCIGAGLMALSIAQTQSYDMFLWKNAYGQVLLLITFLLIQAKNYVWSAFPFALLLITHKTTSLLAIISLSTEFIFLKTKYRLWFLFGMLAAAGIFLFGLNGYQYIKTLQDSEVRNGIFLSFKEYLSFSWYLLPLAVWGIYQSIKRRKELAWLSLTLLTLFMIFAGTIFHQRMIFFLDLSLIVFSALSIHYLPSKRSLKLVAAAVVIIIASVGLINFTKQIQPAITETEIKEIQAFSTYHQGAFVLAINSLDGPWLLANLSGNIRLAAPGQFEDTNSLVQWQMFWQNPTNSKFLSTYPSPLYLYLRSNQSQLSNWQCLNKVSQNFYEYTCK